MERLTRRMNNNKITAIKGSGSNYGAQSFDCQTNEGNDRLRMALEKLADYEDLEEQGLLVRLPYNNGTLYSVNYSNKTIAENTIIEIAINDHSKRFSCLDDNLRERKFYDYMIGKTVFLTSEEAEKKLDEMNDR
mgnify:CR=1 FL=1